MPKEYISAALLPGIDREGVLRFSGGVDRNSGDRINI